ncbi:MAG: YeeE/YedE family protein [Nanoarchaeota archaeon]|nr:YeeE/YedE family protein [Nanoarchaeota archaeon]
MIENLFPNGILMYLLGGIILGIAFWIMYIPTGYIPGASGSLSSIASFFSKKIPGDFRKHRVIYFVATVAGATIFMFLFSKPFVTQVSLWRLIVGGYLVGLGAVTARGCTSGHGIAGLGSLAKSSIIFIAIIMVVAIVTATAMNALGVAL